MNSRISRLLLRLLTVVLGMIILGLPNGYTGETTLNDEEEFGKSLFMKGNYGSAATGALPPKNVLISLQATKPDLFAPYFTNFGFIRDPENPEPFGLPIGLAESVIDESVDFTCAACHSGNLPTGEFKLGMPNTTLNLGAFSLALAEALGRNLPPAQKAALASWGPGRVDDVTGVNDEGLNIPSNIPAHWGDLDNWNFFEHGGETRDYQERNAFTYFLLGVDPSFGTLPPEEDMAALVKFLKTIEPPINPDIDEEAAKRGEEVFKEVGCIQCHNGPDHMNNDFIVPLSDRDRIPGEDPQFPNGSIATDPLRNCLARDACGGNILSKLLASGVELVATDGYKVAPLSGVWATPPYLHNGSVPTLRDLLERANDRPVTFAIGNFLFNTTVDVSGPGNGGNGNQGHEFGVDLTAEEKDDLVEFLKSL
jgi:mono/diheme cytochrome c family protein